MGTFGVMMAVGVMFSIKVAARECGRAGFTKDQFYNFAVYLLLGAIAGARLLYVIVEWKEFLQNPFGMIFAREGFVFFGGFVAAAGVGFWYARRLKLKPWTTADFIAPYIPLGHAFGRIGCFLNGCCHGLRTESAWGLPIQGMDGRYFPIQLVESLTLFGLFALLCWLRKKLKREGAVFLLYVFLYSLARVILEAFRGDPRGSFFGVLSTSQEISILLVAVSGVWLVSLPHGKEKS